MINIIKDRIYGTILGTAIGDALGMPVESLKPEQIRKYYGKISGFRTPKPKKRCPYHKLNRGQWTDDTQLMLAIGESIVEDFCIDYNNIAFKHTQGIEDRRGWGRATTKSIQRIIDGTKWWSSGEEGAAGNGPPMKIAPIGVLFGMGMIDKFEMVSIVINISRMTHKDPRATIAAILQAELIASGIKDGLNGLINEFNNLSIKSLYLEKSIGSDKDFTLTKNINDALILALANDSDEKIKEHIGSGAFVNESFAFICGMILKHINNGLEHTLLNIINQGGDCDTTGAMAGAILGACFGYSVFPTRWKRDLEQKIRLLKLAKDLWKLTTQKVVIM